MDLSHFYLPWLAAVAATSQEPKIAAGTALVIHFDVYVIPVVQLVLAIAGVLMGWPIRPRRKPAIGPVRNALVTLIMLIVAVTWVAQSNPGPLFTFVVSIGLGFSGYALIELAGRELEGFVKRIFAGAAATIDSIGKKS